MIVSLSFVPQLIEGDRRVVVIHSLEIPRLREGAPELEIIAVEQLGSDELLADDGTATSDPLGAPRPADHTPS